MRSKKETSFKKAFYASSFKHTTRTGARELKLMEARLSSIKPSKSLLHVTTEVTGAEMSIEENLLAILDISGVRDAEDIEDDKINFIEALHAVSIASIVPNVPTKKLFEAIIQGLQGSKTMEVTMASYQLLRDLNKVFPHASTSDATSKEGLQLVIDHKVWTPLAPKMADIDGKRSRQVFGSLAIGVLGLPTLLQSILDSFNQKQIDSCIEQSNKNLARTLIFRYLITLLWTDFDCRMKVFEACRDEVLWQNSFLNYHLQGQDKRTYTDFMKNLLHVIADTNDSKHEMSTIDQNSEQTDTQCSTIDYKDTACMKDFTCDNHLQHCAITYISMVISLSRTITADQMTPELAHCNQRLDCFDTLMDILNYNKSMLEPLLKAIEAPSLKLYFTLHYFVKLAPKPVVKQMQANQTTLSLHEMLKCFSDQKNVRHICRCINIDVLQTLLSHSFQAFLLLHGDPNVTEVVQEVCNLLRDAFSNLQRITNRGFQVQTVAKLSLLIVEALSHSIRS